MLLVKTPAETLRASLRKQEEQQWEKQTFNRITIADNKIKKPPQLRRLQLFYQGFL